MSTKQQTDTTNKYDPTSMGTFQGMQGGLGNAVNSYMSNPFGNPFMQTQQQMGTRQAQNLGGTQMSNISRNITGSGMGGGNMSPAALEMMQNQGRANTGLQSQLGFLQPMQNALGMQQNAMGIAANYRPLQTGGTQTQSTGGLGTWLPQVAGMALGGLTGGLMGGMGGPTSGLFMGGSPQALAGSNAANQGFIGGMNTQMPMGGLQGPGGFAGAGGGPPPQGMGGSWWPGMGG